MMGRNTLILGLLVAAFLVIIDLHAPDDHADAAALPPSVFDTGSDTQSTADCLKVGATATGLGFLVGGWGAILGVAITAGCFINQKTDGGLLDIAGVASGWADTFIAATVGTVLQKPVEGLLIALFAGLDDSSNIISQTPGKFTYDLHAVVEMHKASKILGFSLLSVMLLWGAIGVMLRAVVKIPYPDAFTLIGKVVIAAILIAFSKDIVQGMITVNDAAICYFGAQFSEFVEKGETTINPADSYDPDTGEKIDRNVCKDSRPPGFTEVFKTDKTMLATFFALGYALVLLVLVIFMVMRIVAIAAMIVIAPIAFALWVLPATEQWAGRWWNFVPLTIYTQFVQMLALMLGMTVVAGVTASEPIRAAANAGGDDISSVTQILFGIATLWLVLKVPGILNGGALQAGAAEMLGLMSGGMAKGQALMGGAGLARGLVGGSLGSPAARAGGAVGGIAAASSMRTGPRVFGLGGSLATVDDQQTVADGVPPRVNVKTPGGSGYGESSGASGTQASGASGTRSSGASDTRSSGASDTRSSGASGTRSSGASGTQAIVETGDAAPVETGGPTATQAIVETGDAAPVETGGPTGTISALDEQRNRRLTEIRLALGGPTDTEAIVETGDAAPVETGGPTPVETGGPTPVETGGPTPVETGRLATGVMAATGYGAARSSARAGASAVRGNEKLGKRMSGGSLSRLGGWAQAAAIGAREGGPPKKIDAKAIREESDTLAARYLDTAGVTPADMARASAYRTMLSISEADSYDRLAVSPEARGEASALSGVARFVSDFDRNPELGQQYPELQDAVQHLRDEGVIPESSVPAQRQSEARRQDADAIGAVSNMLHDPLGWGRRAKDLADSGNTEQSDAIKTEAVHAYGWQRQFDPKAADSNLKDFRAASGDASITMPPAAPPAAPPGGDD